MKPVIRDSRALAAAVERVHALALGAAERALLRPEDAGYDGSGDVPWAERSTRVVVGLMLASKALDHARDNDAGARAFGLMVLRDRFKDPGAWEHYAAAVDAAPAPTVQQLEPVEDK